MSDTLRDEAIALLRRAGVGISGDYDRSGKEIAADALSPLLDELAALRRWKVEALPVLAGLQELGRALGLPLGEQITGPRAVEAAKALRATTLREAAEDRSSPAGPRSYLTPEARQWLRDRADVIDDTPGTGEH